MEVTDNSMVDIFTAIQAERKRQDELHPWDKLDVRMTSGGTLGYDAEAKYYKEWNDKLESIGVAHIDSLIIEEYYEVFSETRPKKQRKELIHLAALCVKVIEKIDRESKENA